MTHRMIFVCIGRILLMAIFLWRGIDALFHFGAYEQIFVNAMLELLNYSSTFPGIEKFFGALIAHPSIALIIGLSIDFLGIFFILVGIRIHLGIYLLLVFLIFTTFLFHQFWLAKGSIRELKMIMFFQNLSIMGGLLVLMGYNSNKRKQKYG